MVKMKKTLVFKKIVFLFLFVLFYIYYLTPIIDGWKTDQNRKKQLTDTKKNIEYKVTYYPWSQITSPILWMAFPKVLEIDLFYITLDLCADHVILTGLQMTNLVLNFECLFWFFSSADIKIRSQRSPINSKLSLLS